MFDINGVCQSWRSETSGDAAYLEIITRRRKSEMKTVDHGGVRYLEMQHI